MPRSAEKIYDNALEFYDRAISMHPKLERKGKTMPYTSINGHMSSFLDKEGVMGLRLSPTDRDVFIKTHNSMVMEQYGRKMKEFVVIPESLLSDSLALVKYLDKSYAYVSLMKPKKK